MAPRKKVVSLKDSCLQTFGVSITTHATTLFEMADLSLSSKLDTIRKLKSLLCDDVPSCLHDSIAQNFLEGLQKFYDAHFISDSESSTKCETVLKNLAFIVPHLEVKNICLGYWAEPICSILTQHFCKMTSLETLSCNVSFERDEKSFQQTLVDAIPFFPNLISFAYYRDCSNKIISKISECCKSMSKIVVRCSENVTDACIENLANCQVLESLDLLDTSVTEYGYLKLLMTTKSKSLSDVTRFQIESKNLLYKKKNCLTPFHTFPLRELGFSKIAYNPNQVSLTHKYFPHLIKLSLDHDGGFDLTALLELESLKELRLHAYGDLDYTDSLGNFLSVKGTSLTSLELFQIQGSPMKIVYDIAIFCPNIENLVFIACLFRGETTTKLPKIQCQSKPFQKLRTFTSFIGIPLSCLKLILHHAHNISYVSVASAETISDEFFKDILRVNPLKKLSCLEVGANAKRVSAKMLMFIISNCDEITSLKGFTSLKKSDLKSLKDFILVNNYDVNLNPPDKRRYLSDIICREIEL